jgi:hypothetical protein
MSRSFGAGSPLWFRCKCGNRAGAVTLTGRTKPRRRGGALGTRHSHVSREYRCTCGHVGWSTHKELLRGYVGKGT